MSSNGNGIGTGETYRFPLGDLHPFSSLLNTPITVLNFIIWASSVPKVEEDLEIMAFERPKAVNMEPNLPTSH